MSDSIKDSNNWRVDVDGAKYTVVFKDGYLSALRYGQAWRDCVVDNLIYWLAVELQEARAALTLRKAQELEAACTLVEQALRACGGTRVRLNALGVDISPSGWPALHIEGATLWEALKKTSRADEEEQL